MNDKIECCIDCITFAICRGQFMSAYDMMIDHNKTLDKNAEKIYVVPVLAAYRQTLLNKCSIIQQYLYDVCNPTYNRDNRSVVIFDANSTSKREMLNNTFIKGDRLLITLSIVSYLLLLLL